MKLLIKLITIAVFISALLFFVGCEKSNPTAPDGLNYQNNSPAEMTSEVSMTESLEQGTPGNGYWPIIASHTFTYNNRFNGYNGGEITFGLNNKSKFRVSYGALTPPPSPSPGLLWEDITITLQIDYDSTTQELLFEFGPHGCQFSPRAQLKMDYSVLGVAVPVLFYFDEEGNRIEMEPNQINTNDKWLMVRLDHFSRYAIAISR